MAIKNYVKLKISSKKYTPEKLNELIGMECDKCWAVGDLRENTIMKEKSNGWVVESKLDVSVELENHIIALFDRISRCKDVIKKLSLDNNVELLCAVYSDDIPSLYLDKNIIQKIARIGASFDIDLYLLNTVAAR